MSGRLLVQFEKILFFFKSVTYFNFKEPLATTRSIISLAPAVIHTTTHTHTGRFPGAILEKH